MQPEDSSTELIDRFLDRVLRGERPDLEQFLTEHPELDEASRRRVGRLAHVLLGGGMDEAGPPEALGGSGAPEQLGEFKILRCLGRGGMGVVYLAEQEGLGRQVALKVIRPGLTDSKAASRRFAREAQAVARLRHPNIVTIYGTGEDQGIPYIAMELVPGEGLDEKIEALRSTSQRLPVQQAVRYARDVAQALACAHDAGLVHRDVKPSNIRIRPDGRALLLDFGLARGGDLATVTQEGRFHGTPFYASPEQVAAKDLQVDARSDVYSLGVTLYECVTGRVPFSGQTTEQVLQQILSRQPLLPRRIDPAIPRDLETIILTAMEKDPAERYRDASAMADDLEALLDIRPIQARPTSRLRAAWKWNRRRPAAALATLLAFILVVGAPLGYGVLQHQSSIRIGSERDQANQARDAAREAHREASRHLAEILRLSDALLVGELEGEARDLWPRHPGRVAAMNDWLERARELVQRRLLHEDTLARMIEDRGRPTPEDPRSRWQFETTRELVQDLTRLEELVADVTERRDFASTIEQRSVTDHAEDWEDIITEIALGDAYDGLEISPQIGLVPLGVDFQTGLAEFWHVESGQRPGRDENERLVLQADTGLVFVLLPAAVVEIGAATPATAKPGNRNIDAQATANEAPVHRVELDAFFLSRYEMTQGQWLLCAGSNPSTYHAGKHDGDKLMTLAQPVENVSWDMCHELFGKLGLEIPTETQWEYGARGGTHTPWWTGDHPRLLEGAANLADRFLKRNGGAPAWVYEEWLDDGWAMHAEVGSYAPNPFGFHDVIGNVSEWTRDAYEQYDQPVRPGDGLRVHRGREGFHDAVFRGGSYVLPAREARSSVRYVQASDDRSPEIGVRPMRRLDR